MKNKKIIAAALILATCTASALTSCGGNNTNNGGSNENGGNDGERVTTNVNGDKTDKETEGNILDGVESGLEDIGSDIKDSVSNPEDATHGTEKGDETENRTEDGGSMNEKNAAELLAKPNVDGGLIGGASLVATKFQAIVDAAQ